MELRESVESLESLENGAEVFGKHAGPTLGLYGSESTRQHFLIELTVEPEMALLSRVNLVFSRRGLAIDEFHFRRQLSTEGKSDGKSDGHEAGGLIAICFTGTPAELDSVSRDLKKIYGVEQMTSQTNLVKPFF
jgi:hypothetical protein